MRGSLKVSFTTKRGKQISTEIVRAMFTNGPKQSDRVE
jgi:hypothetical protein